MKRIILIVFGDFVSFWVAFFIVLTTRFWGTSYWIALQSHFAPFSILYMVWTLTFFLFGLYDIFSIKPTIPRMRTFGFALLLSFIVGILLFYFVPIFGIAPKTNLVYQVIGFGIFSFIIRRSIYFLFSKQITRPVVLVGINTYLDTLKEIISHNPQLGLTLLAHTPNTHQTLKTYIHTPNTLFIIEDVVNTLPKSDILMFYKNGMEIITITEAYERFLFKIPIGYISQSWILEHINTYRASLVSTTGRIIDIIFSFIILCISSPFTLVGALAIYLNDGGPIFYKQERIGRYGKIFKLYKLRSMTLDAEKNGAVWAETNDLRITRVGKILRKSHIDEIPQMINVIKGDLALIGPRPERPEFVKQLEQTIPHYELRHIIRPGFTGWAQIKYRYARTIDDSREKYEYDLYYIKNRNIFLDFGILLRTIQIIFTH